MMYCHENNEVKYSLYMNDYFVDQLLLDVKHLYNLPVYMGHFIHIFFSNSFFREHPLLPHKQWRAISPAVSRLSLRISFPLSSEWFPTPANRIHSPWKTPPSFDWNRRAKTDQYDTQGVSLPRTLEVRNWQRIFQAEEATNMILYVHCSEADSFAHLLFRLHPFSVVAGWKTWIRKVVKWHCFVVLVVLGHVFMKSIKFSQLKRSL